jgi:hypothetical protein
VVERGQPARGGAAASTAHDREAAGAAISHEDREFIASWTALVCEYNKKGTFNVKKAKEVSKAFHDLEKSGGWPKKGAPDDTETFRTRVWSKRWPSAKLRVVKRIPMAPGSYGRTC